MTRQCTAKSKSSGGRCKNAPIPGGTTCRYHGGSAPQVQKAARQRLLEAADPAAARMIELLYSDDERIAFGAAKDLLDRSGNKWPTEVKIESADDAARILRDELERRGRDN